MTPPAAANADREDLCKTIADRVLQAIESEIQASVFDISTLTLL